MKKNLLLIALLLAATGSVYAYDDHDFAAWNTDLLFRKNCFSVSAGQASSEKTGFLQVLA